MAGCTSPVAAYAEIRGSKCYITGLYWRESDENWFVEKTSGNKKEAELLGETLAHNMQEKVWKIEKERIWKSAEKKDGKGISIRQSMACGSRTGRRLSFDTESEKNGWMRRM